MVARRQYILLIAVSLVASSSSSSSEPDQHHSTTPLLRKRHLRPSSHNNRYSNQNRSYQDNSAGCEDTSGTFRIENPQNVLTMTCSDLSRSVYRFGCTWSKVRIQCPKTCDSCPNKYLSSNDYGSEYLVSEDYKPSDIDNTNYNDQNNGNGYGNDGNNVGYNNGGNNGGYDGNCKDITKKFRLKWNGEFIKCSALLTSAHTGKCKWKRVIKICPATCGACTSVPTQYAATNSNYDPHDDEGDDFY